MSPQLVMTEPTLWEFEFGELEACEGGEDLALALAGGAIPSVFWEPCC